MVLKVLDLFSGIGGFSLGLERAGMQTIAFCELEDYPVSILNKHWPDVPVYRDVRKLNGKQFSGTIDVICGGFPCQPFSVAGKQKGKEDDRHLWPEMLRVIRETKPTWVIGENVSGFIRMALDDVLLDLENQGYTAQPFVIPACAVGAIHRRDRVWIIAHANSKRESIQPIDGETGQRVCGNAKYNGRNETEIKQSNSKRNERNKEGQIETFKFTRSSCARYILTNTEYMRQQYSQHEAWARFRKGLFTWRSINDGANPINEGLQRCQRISKNKGKIKKWRARPYGAATKLRNDFNRRAFKPIGIPAQPPVCHRNDGVPDRVARLKALGNAVVPQIPELIGRFIIEYENCKQASI